MPHGCVAVFVVVLWLPLLPRLELELMVLSLRFDMRPELLLIVLVSESSILALRLSGRRGVEDG